MLSFQEQEKVLRPIMDRETNKHCADCGSHTPTWASLDFGVFVCSNCSGAHRALGPTITRIKSTKLDQWNKDWVQNMRIGNLEVNQYWEADSKTATVKKPRAGASLDQHNRYVYDKYVRRKFVTDKTATDPLKVYKANKPSGTAQQPQPFQKPRTIYISQPDLEMPSIIGLPKKFSETSAMKESFNLLDDEQQFSEISDHKRMKKGNEDGRAHSAEHNGSSTEENPRMSKQEDEFTDYIEPAQLTAQASNPGQKDPSKLSFDELFKQPQVSPVQSQPQNLPPYTAQQQQVLGHAQWNTFGHQHAMNGQNMGGIGYAQGLYPQQGQYVNQFAHNPYIGYAPHNSLHAAYNMNFGSY